MGLVLKKGNPFPAHCVNTRLGVYFFNSLRGLKLHLHYQATRSCDPQKHLGQPGCPLSASHKVNVTLL